MIQKIKKPLSYNTEIRSHILWAKAMGFCEQCQKPWNDGLCECGFSDKHKEEMEVIEKLANKLIAEGWGS